jgi:hypothetical protein
MGGGSSRGESVMEQSDEAIQQLALLSGPWIASRSLSSGAHLRDPLARNDDYPFGNFAFKA